MNWRCAMWSRPQLGKGHSRAIEPACTWNFALPTACQRASRRSTVLLGCVVHAGLGGTNIDNEATAVALAPGDPARRLCANLPLALRAAAVT